MEQMIHVENVSMSFRIDKNHTTSLKEWFINFLKGKQKYEEFSALKNVSFDVNKGEVLGIIGTNGSGKSTLLKVISGIYKPTEGKAYTRGHIAPMLELGSGFDPELSGRENIFLKLGIQSGRQRLAGFFSIDSIHSTPQYSIHSLMLYTI